mgnify:CR=1 FL=1
MRFGEYIRSLRVAAGMNATAAGRSIGVSGSYIVQIERGKIVPPEERATQLARLYGVGVENVLNRMRDDQIADLLQMLAELLQGAGYRDAWLAVLSAKTAMPERYEPPPENNRLRRPRLAKRGARKRLTRAHIAAGTRPW